MKFVWISRCECAILEMQTEFFLRSLFFKCNAVTFFLSRKHGTWYRHLHLQTPPLHKLSVKAVRFLFSYDESSCDSSVDTATSHLQHGSSSSLDNTTIFPLRCSHPVTPTMLTDTYCVLFPSGVKRSKHRDIPPVPYSSKYFKVSKCIKIKHLCKPSKRGTNQQTVFSSSIKS
jgi:hypothetical protein